MKRRRYSEAEIARILREVGSNGSGVSDSLARLGVPRRTFYHWLARYGDDAESTLARLKQLERALRGSQRRLRALQQENQLLRELLGKPWRRLPPGGQPSRGP